MTYREDELIDPPVDEQEVLEDVVAEDAIRLVGEEIDPDSVRPAPPDPEDGDEVLVLDDDDVRRGL